MAGAAERPLSPHLQIYRPMLTMMMSIVHRITGVALYFGTLLLVIWLVAAASSPAAFDTVNGLYGSWIGLLVLVGYSWALIHHALGGIRHFIWDTGAGFGPQAREWMARATIGGSIGLTVLLWIIIWLVKG
ncbi:succinate dehydrogenase, cytochrome b556 subunit [Ancylobacter novellus DSM 506]|uniref:Succinate dehydrogenase cytochrome b556 subunit n=1 Tax=Ancylobacter novellus (strain ATCC 8093 / DSM 506 / JCM 20403 / CCM 1077 / IAM 12100 / NBRC 12443 / NCIMB 10456) TaxID=639283 RepID=D7A8R0_ANCN5|nr:succinate dehydrogenase, cytochrome b556 subunit [Ancylobacter novellus]ADH90594.1 succinate dehydrogenase, cytochrome b556 subunit [Ancylobacter novellus DSM 506]